MRLGSAIYLNLDLQMPHFCSPGEGDGGGGSGPGPSADGRICRTGRAGAARFQRGAWVHHRRHPEGQALQGVRSARMARVQKCLVPRDAAAIEGHLHGAESTKCSLVI